MKQQRERHLQNLFFSEQFSSKLERLVAQVGYSSYQPQTRRFIINDEVNFYRGVREALQVSQECFEKQLKIMGFKRIRESEDVEYRWCNKQRFSLSKEMGLLTGTLKAHGDVRKQLLQDVSLKKKQIDQMLEDMIFRLLVKGSVGKEQTEVLNRITSVVHTSIQDINSKAVRSVENLQQLYEQELKLYKKMVSNGEEAN